MVDVQPAEPVTAPGADESEPDDDAADDEPWDDEPWDDEPSWAVDGGAGRESFL